MLSNIEPLAREMTLNICRRSGMADADTGAWVDLHWTCAAAMLEAGVMDEAGEWIPGKDWRRGLAAYRDKVAINDRPVLVDPRTRPMVGVVE
jgi:hypothetical protein